MRQRKTIILVSITTLLLICACKDRNASHDKAQSIGELRREAEKARAQIPDREPSEQARQRHLPQLSEWTRPTPQDFLHDAADLARWRTAMSGATAVACTKEQHAVVSEITRCIGKLVWKELDAISPEFPHPYDQINPLRAGWVLTWDAEAGIDIDGIGGYFGNDAYEAPLAGDAFGFYGMKEHANMIREAMSLWPGDKPLDAYPVPLDEQRRKRLHALEDAFWKHPTDPYIVRALFALENPKYFFAISE